MTSYTNRDFQTISAETGFDQGDRFTSESQVREYFTVANMTAMFGPFEPGDEPDQEALEAMAKVVIENRWHCAF